MDAPVEILLSRAADDCHERKWPRRAPHAPMHPSTFLFSAVPTSNPTTTGRTLSRIIVRNVPALRAHRHAGHADADLRSHFLWQARM